MKKIYLIYAKIPSLLFDSKMHNFVNDSSKYKLSNGYYIGLYGWTSKKFLLNEFLEFREGAKSIYTVITRKFTKNEYKIFKKENYYEELMYYRLPSQFDFDDTYSEGWIPSKKDSEDDRKDFFSGDNGIIHVVCTRNEGNSLFEHGTQYLFEYMSQITSVEYLVFKDEYKLLLDYFGYCDLFNDIHDGLDNYDNHDSFYSDRNEMTEYMRGYNMTYYGNKYIDLYANKALLFINIFYEMIVGYTHGTEIKLVVYD